MARINVEDSIYRDERFHNLVHALGDKYRALGAMVAAWDMAQRWYSKSPHKVIPVDEWRKFSLATAIEKAQLCRYTEFGVYVCGSEEQFKWLEQRIRAGQSSSLKRWGNKDNGRQRNVTECNGTSPSSSPSSSSSSSTSKNKKEESSELFALATRLRTCGLSASQLDQLIKIYSERGVKTLVQDNWIDAYPDAAWIARESFKAYGWEMNNPRKKKKNFGLFLYSWLARGWDSHTKTLPSNQVRTSMAEILGVKENEHS